jgi:predicted nucleotidyltransferase
LLSEIGADKPRFDLFDLSGVRLRLIEIMEREVDLITRGGIRHRRRERIEADLRRVI